MSDLRTKTASPSDDPLSLRDILIVLFRYKFLFFLLVVLSVCVAVLRYTLYPSFQSNADLFVQGVETSPLQVVSANLSGFNSSGGETTEFAEKYVQYLSSFNFFVNTAEFLLKDEQFLKLKGVSKDQRTLAEDISAWTSIGKSSKDRISIGVRTPNKKLTLRLVNTLKERAVKMITEYELKELNDAEGYVRVQVEGSEKAIKRTESEIVELKKKNNLLSINSSTSGHFSQAGRLTEELEKATIAFEQNRKLIASLEGDLQDKKNELKGLRHVHKHGISRRIQELRRENQFLNVRKDTIKTKLEETIRSRSPLFEQKIADLVRKLELEYSLYEELKKQFFQIQMHRISVKNRVSYLEETQDFEVRRSTSLAILILIAVISALAVGSPIVYASEVLVPRVKGKPNLDQLGLIYLGGVPEVKESWSEKRKAKKKKKRQARISLTTGDSFNDEISLAIKYIRTRILYTKKSDGQPTRIISLHSTQDNEGKTFVSRKIASSLAHLGKRTLFIDADFKRGSASKEFNARHLPGLGEILTGTEKFGKVVKRGILPKMDLLPTGTVRMDSTELFSSEIFKTLVEDLKEVYDFILFDTPTFTGSPDASLIARRSDIVILVTAQNLTRLEDIEESIEYFLGVDKGMKLHAILNRSKRKIEPFRIIRKEDILSRRKADIPPRQFL